MYKLIIVGILSLMAFSTQAQEIKPSCVKKVEYTPHAGFNKSKPVKRSAVKKDIKAVKTVSRVQLKSEPVKEK